LFSLFATGVVYTSCKFAAGVVDTSGNLPPASLTPVANFASGIVDTGGKFAKGINNTSKTTVVEKCIADTGGKFAASVVDTGGAP
jgi:hypothetical protein